MCKPVVSLDGHALFTHASRAYDAPSGRVLNYHAYTFLFRMGTYNYRQIRRCDVTGLVLCAAPELHNKNPYAWTKSRMKYFGFVPRQYSTVHTVQTDMRPLVVLIDLMCIAPGGGIPSTSDTYCRRVKSKKKNILSPRLENPFQASTASGGHQGPRITVLGIDTGPPYAPSLTSVCAGCAPCFFQFLLVALVDKCHISMQTFPLSFLFVVVVVVFFFFHFYPTVTYLSLDHSAMLFGVGASPC